MIWAMPIYFGGSTPSPSDSSRLHRFSSTWPIEPIVPALLKVPVVQTRQEHFIGGIGDHAIGLVLVRKQCYDLIFKVVLAVDKLAASDPGLIDGQLTTIDLR
jgi:hypothetical protein